MPAVFAIFFAAIVALAGAMTLPAREAAMTAAVADKSAVSMLAYRAAVIGYLNTNPTFTGSVPDASITMPNGMAHDPHWTNSVAGGTLYVFEATPSGTAGLLDLIYEKMAKSYTVGRNAGGNFVTAKGLTTGPLPVTAPAIPNGSIVVIGN